MSNPFSQLDEVVDRFKSIELSMSDPALASTPHKYTELAREHAQIGPLVAAYGEWTSLLDRETEAQELREDDDPDMAAMALEELAEIATLKQAVEAKLKDLLRPRDPNEGRNIIVEIRSGTGGDEAALFAGDLFRMYSRFGDNKGWKIEVLNSSATDGGGFREISAVIKGSDAYGYMKHEGGTHRVQRVPATETQGRIHTSAATVAVMPEAEEVDLHIEDKDLRIDVFRASGPGGQSVNTTDSAVRITHLPTGITVSSQDEKSQIKNKAKGMKILRSRVLEMEQQRVNAERADLRRGQVGSGDRSEKIRTYNYPQNRVTDHRASITKHNLDRSMMGDIGELLEEVAQYFEAEALKQSAS